MYTTAIIFGAFYFIFSENDYVIGQKTLTILVRIKWPKTLTLYDVNRRFFDRE